MLTHVTYKRDQLLSKCCSNILSKADCDTLKSLTCDIIKRKKTSRGCSSGGNRRRKIKDDCFRSNSGTVNFTNFSYLTQVKDSPARELLNSTVSLLNARSVKHKTIELNDFICEHDLDILAVTEIWLGANDDAVFVPDAYFIQHKPRHSRNGGGLALIYKNLFELQTQNQTSYSSFEYLDCIVDSLSSAFRIDVLYRPPDNRLKSKFIDEFSDLINQLAKCSLELVILGDFNCHVDNINDKFSFQFCELLQVHSLIQHVNTTTHNQGHTLDLVITRQKHLINNLSVRDKLLSDHFPIILNLNIRKEQFETRQISFRKFKSLNDADLSSSLCSSNLNSIYQINDVNSKAAYFNKCVQNIIDDLAPIHTKIFRLRPSAP
ncbi:hypothetical protein SNE40_019711 [Patella caerulea]|uniref:Endonuclease/exonuclease/phosphatase domain-containing protein n=1 Tax=Patella caerulea TaxID=87958 RepID=A0AAN8J7I7_PATCE